MRLLILTAIVLTSLQAASAQEQPRTLLVDPLSSGNWAYHQIEILGDPEDISFDNRVVVKTPKSAEDSFHVPVLVDASKIADVRRIVLFVDYGPIPKILTYWPEKAEAKLSFRFKIDQATAIRAAVETNSGSWHIGSNYIDAGGGGCTAPAQAYVSDDWEQHLGEVHGLVWPDKGRVRMIVDHPMDTGLADGIPVFIIKKLQLDDMNGTRLAHIDLHEPVNEDPVFTFFFPKGQLGNKIRVRGRDNNGNKINAVLRSRLTQ